MKLLNEVLVATDFSRAADNAVETASYVAKLFGSRVHLLHVITRQGIGLGPPEDIREAVLRRLREITDRLESDGVRCAEPTVKVGLEFFQIDQYAREEDVNIIIIGAGEKADSGQVYLGSTASRLRRKSEKPVWIVKPDSLPPIQQILCPVDGSTSSSRALANAIHLARRFDAELTVITVFQVLPREYEWLPQSPPDNEEDTPPYVKEFNDFVEAHDFFGVRWHKLARRGRPSKQIIRAAREIDAQVIVMGSVGRTGLAHMLVGGVARRVAQEMPCSVITVRSEEPIRARVEGEIAEIDVNFCAGKKSFMSCERLEQGRELLSEGFPDKAATHFRECIDQYDLCPQAWECLGSALARLGDDKGARHCVRRSEELQRILVNQEIEADVRQNHPLFRSIFGV
jgi:universal stress protein E